MYWYKPLLLTRDAVDRVKMVITINLILDFPTDQTFHQFHDLYTELDLHRIMSGFHGAFATGVASQQGTLTLPDTWFRPPFWDLLMPRLLRPNSSNLPCLYSTFHLEYPLVLSRFCFESCQTDLWTVITSNKTCVCFVKLSYKKRLGHCSSGVFMFWNTDIEFSPREKIWRFNLNKGMLFLQR